MWAPEWGWVSGKVLYAVVAEDCVDFMVILCESMWAIFRDSGHIGVADYEDRHL